MYTVEAAAAAAAPVVPCKIPHESCMVPVFATGEKQCQFDMRPQAEINTLRHEYKYCHFVFFLILFELNQADRLSTDRS